ncbi:cyclin-like protein [Tribonema minus]|uniref:Cyclin-like protein n=1 Tax=Tribonema minus TaxID=303371 RepID=A0A836CKN2_9STRA|nr:cyclin-like protein [Tribonema minus]
MPAAQAGGKAAAPRRAALGDITNDVHKQNNGGGKQSGHPTKVYATRSKSREARSSSSSENAQQQAPHSSAAVASKPAAAAAQQQAGSAGAAKASAARAGASQAAAAGPSSGGAVVPSARSANDIDERDRKEPLAVTEYVEDLYSYLRAQEQVTRLSPAAIEDQEHVSARMFAILVDWLVEVHLRFRLVPDTLYLTVYVIARYLALTPAVTRSNLQLVGVTALLLASKYEEIYPPEIRDLVYMTDKAYTKEQILDMETEMLNRLEFRITVPTTYCFLLRYLKAAHADRRIVQLSCYVAERMLQEARMLRHLPSVAACAAIYLARRNLGRNAWSPTLEKYTGYVEADLASCLRDTCELMAACGDLKAVRSKFTSKQFGAVATMDIDLSCDDEEESDADISI